jgi:hypothetical protein
MNFLRNFEKKKLAATPLLRRACVLQSDNIRAFWPPREGSIPEFSNDIFYFPEFLSQKKSLSRIPELDFRFRHLDENTRFLVPPPPGGGGKMAKVGILAFRHLYGIFPTFLLHLSTRIMDETKYLTLRVISGVYEIRTLIAFTIYAYRHFRGCLQRYWRHFLKRALSRLLTKKIAPIFRSRAISNRTFHSIVLKRIQFRQLLCVPISIFIGQ